MRCFILFPPKNLPWFSQHLCRTTKPRTQLSAFFTRCCYCLEETHQNLLHQVLDNQRSEQGSALAASGNMLAAPPHRPSFRQRHPQHQNSKLLCTPVASKIKRKLDMPDDTGGQHTAVV